jgi:hypothetical protein
VHRREEVWAFEHGDCFEKEGVHKVKLRTDERGGVAVAGPACYGNHIERLVEEGSESGKGG